MQINQAQVDAVQAEIQAGVTTAATIAGTVAPEYLPFIILGQAVAKAIPSLVDDVVELINQTEPSDAMNAALATKITNLGNPAAL